MNAVVTIETGTDIILAVEETPQIVLLEPEKFDQFYERVKAETEKLVIDVTTKRGRDAIIAMAAKVTKSKTAIDKARLQLTGAWREQTNQVNAAGKEIETRLATLAREVRQPVTDWEVAEKERIDSCRADIDAFKRASVVTLDDTAATVRERGQEVWRQEIDPERFGDLLDEAVAAKDTAVAALKAALARLTLEEADKAELEKLRAAQAKRDEADRLAAEAERLLSQRRCYARSIIEHINQCGLGMIGGKTYPYGVLLHELESKIVATEEDFGDMAADVEKARADTLARLSEAMAREVERDRKEAAEQAARDAREEESRKADAEKEKRVREHAEELAAAEARAKKAEADAKAERDRAAQAAADAEAAAKAEAAEQARRDKNRAHRAQIMGEAKIAIMAAGSVDDAAAALIVKAIVASLIPHVSLRF